MLSRIFVVCALIFFLAANRVGQDHIQVQAQTFGPICDTLIPGVTCVPTARPTTPPNSRPPVSGNATTTLLLLGMGGIFTLGGVTGFASFLSKKE